jgi:hypothetical protein
MKDINFKLVFSGKLSSWTDVFNIIEQSEDNHDVRFLIKVDGTTYSYFWWNEYTKSWNMFFSYFKNYELKSTTKWPYYWWPDAVDVYMVTNPTIFIRELQNDLRHEAFQKLTYPDSKLSVMVDMIKPILGSVVEVKDEKVLLLGLSYTFDDYYYYYLTQDNKIGFTSSVGKIVQHYDQTRAELLKEDIETKQLVQNLRWEHFKDAPEIEIIHV